MNPQEISEDQKERIVQLIEVARANSQDVIDSGKGRTATGPYILGLEEDGYRVLFNFILKGIEAEADSMRTGLEVLFSLGLQLGAQAGRGKAFDELIA